MSDREVVRRVFSDPTERAYHFTLTQDVEPIIEDNKRLKAEPQKSDFGRHVARVPDVIVAKWLNEEWSRGNTELRFLGKGFNDWFKKKIDDPDNSAWRTDNPSNPFYIGYGK